MLPWIRFYSNEKYDASIKLIIVYAGEHFLISIYSGMSLNKLSELRT